MKKRMITGLVLGLILIPFLLFSNVTVFCVGVIIPVIIASYEMIRMFKDKQELSLPVKIICIILVLLAYVSIVGLWCTMSGVDSYFESESVFKFFNSIYTYCNITVILMVLSLIVLALTIFVKEFDSECAGRLFLIILYVALGFGSLSILRIIGKRLLIYLFIVTIFTDVFAYFSGMLFGKHKLTPISPKKTWEGSIGGTLIATVFGSLFALNYEVIMKVITKIPAFADEELYDSIFQTVCDIPSRGLEIFTIICITLFTSIIGQIGDLVSSKMKRDNGIKDFSNIFPGHGGVLDRFDSAIYGAMFLVAILTFLKCAYPVL